MPVLPVRLFTRRSTRPCHRDDTRALRRILRDTLTELVAVRARLGELEGRAGVGPGGSLIDLAQQARRGRAVLTGTLFWRHGEAWTKVGVYGGGSLPRPALHRAGDVGQSGGSTVTRSPHPRPAPRQRAFGAAAASGVEGAAESPLSTPAGTGSGPELHLELAGKLRGSRDALRLLTSAGPDGLGLTKVRWGCGKARKHDGEDPWEHFTDHSGTCPIPSHPAAPSAHAHRSSCIAWGPGPTCT